MMTPIQTEKNEWSRMANDAYRNGFNYYGHMFSVASSRPSGYQMTTAEFDKLQRLYRTWLNSGWKEFHHWNKASKTERQAFAAKCGWITGAGKLTTTGELIAATPTWDFLSEAARIVLINYGICE